MADIAPPMVYRTPSVLTDHCAVWAGCHAAKIHRLRQTCAA
ncbi:MAG: hypothetical protein ACPGFC_06950 [Paracoccaceae bacterium]